MRRIPGVGGPRDLDEEKKKSRESVIANLVLFGAFVTIIRLGNFINKNNTYLI